MMTILYVRRQFNLSPLDNCQTVTPSLSLSQSLSLIIYFSNVSCTSDGAICAWETSKYFLKLCVQHGHGHGYKLVVTVLQRKMDSANQTFPIYSATVGIAATCTVPTWFITVTGHGYGVFISAMSSKGK
jgi:hypothetical protein